MRKNLIVLVALAFACPAAAALAGTPGRFMQYPDISGNTIVFTWERDLWTVPADRRRRAAADDPSRAWRTSREVLARRQARSPSRASTTAPTST